MSSNLLSILRRHLKVNNLKLYQYPRRCININNFSNVRSEKYRNLFPKYKFPQHLSVCLQKFSSTYLKRNFKGKYTLNVEDLTSYYLNNGYINHNLFSKVIDALETENFSEKDSIFLLESINYLYTISPSERIENFKKLWTILKTKNFITEEHVLIALKVFQQNKITLDEARKHLNNFENLKLNLNIYEELIRLTCESGDIENATTEILDKMREEKLPLTNKVFNALILGHSRNGNIKHSDAVIDTMNAANLTPTSETYYELVRAYIENDLEEKALTLLNKISNSLSLNQILMLLKSASLFNSKNIIGNLTELLPEEFRNVADLPVSLKSICIELLFSNKVDEAFSILDSFPIPNFKDIQDDDKFGQFFISELIKSEIYSNEKCLEFCKKLIESGKNIRALHIACEICLRKFPDKADYFLRALSNSEKLRPHYFWPLINDSFNKNGEKGIFNILKVMSDLSVECDFDTLYYHCFPRLSIIFKNMEEAAKCFENSGVKSSTFLTPLVLHLIVQQRQNEAIKISSLFQSKINTSVLIQPLVNLSMNANFNKRYQQYARLLKTLVTKSENKNFDLAGQILIELLSSSKFNKNLSTIVAFINELALQEIKISKTTFEFCKVHFNNFDKNEDINKTLLNLSNMTNNELISSNTESSDFTINHPRDMNLKELECHLIELEEKKMNTRGVLRRLLQLYVRENQLENALKLKEKCEEQNVHVSAGMLACILDLHIKLKDLKTAKKTLQNIKKKYPGFLIDEHKIIDLATLMVENDKLQEAENFIVDRTSSTRTVGGEYIYKNLWSLLTQTAHFSARMYPGDTKNLTKDLFFMLKRYKFCQPQNALLGPIIREYLLKNKVKEAVEEFKYIAENFKKTPLQLELMSILVKINNSQNNLKELNISQEEGKTLLQDVVTYCSKIHGSVNCNGTLLLAVAESGNESQLRKLLINPEFRLNIEALAKNVDYLSSNGRIENILKLAKASRGIKHGLNEQELYTILLNEYVKKNNYENAISLYNKLEADDELKISSEFVKILVNLLKVNNKDIPSNIALRAQIKN